MTPIVVALIAILASPAVGSACGWTGLVLEPPDVQVLGADVRLAAPLRVMRVEEASPAEVAGLERGMEIHSLDDQAWDAGGFLPHLVRLRTIAPGESVRLGAGHDGSEGTFRLRAEPCSGLQARRQATTLARLAAMENLASARHGAPVDDGARAQYREAIRAYETAVRHAEQQLKDPLVRSQIENAIRLAQQALPEEEAMRQFQEAVRLAQEAIPDDDALSRLQEAMRLAQQSMHQRLPQEEVEEAMRRAREALSDAGLRERIAEALRETRESLRDDGTLEELRRQMDELRYSLDGQQMRLRQDAMRDAWEAQREALKEALEGARTGEHELLLVQDQIRRALAESRQGQDLRRLALLAAAESARQIHHAGVLFGDGEFEPVGPGLSRHLGVDHGLLVQDLDPESPLARDGLEVGDVILSAGGNPVNSLDDLFHAVVERSRELADDGERDGKLELRIHGPDGDRTVPLFVLAMGARPPV